MLGILYFCAFEAGGILQAECLMKRRGKLVRIWLGLVMGLMELMWLPSLMAFTFTFNVKAHLCALGVLALLTVMCLPLKRKKTEVCYSQPPLRLTLIVMLPIAVLVGYLQYTHTLMPRDGALLVGQSTYGDLCMHLSFATGLIGQSYPPVYTILPGATLGYPFLADALSASMLLFGTSLEWAFVIPGVIMTLLVYLGFFIFAYEVSKRKGAALLALLLLLFSGGLGFLGTFNMAGKSGFAGLKEALQGYYMTPTNRPDLNLRWVNALCDLIIPQRTLMAGWMCVLPAFYLMYTALRSRRSADFLTLGLWSGPMVMIHTHSFLALGAISLGVLIDTLIRDKKHRGKDLLNFGIYGITACVIAYPQLAVWTFPQTFEGGSLRFMFNWVNNNGDGKLIDGYFWFWIKNVGLAFVLIPLAGLSLKNRRIKSFALGALLLFVLSEFVLFQPNVYDNIKLFYLVYVVMLPAAALLMCRIYDKLSFIKGRRIIAAVCVLVMTASGAITTAREWASSYEIFSEGQVDAAEYIKKNTAQDAMFLTSTDHRNAVASLAGRRIVCGSSLYLYFHGLDYSIPEADTLKMLTDPSHNRELFEKYGIEYVYISAWERGAGANNADFDALFEKIYDDGPWYDTVQIYKVSLSDEASDKSACFSFGTRSLTTCSSNAFSMRPV